MLQTMPELHSEETSTRLVASPALPADLGAQLVDCLGSIQTHLSAEQEALARSIGLGGSQLAILAAIDLLDVSSGVSQTDVADHLCVHGSYISSQSKHLARIGFLRREVGLHDRRTVLLSLTDRASRAVHLLGSGKAAFERRICLGIAAEDLSVILNLCRHLEKTIACARGRVDVGQ